MVTATSRTPQSTQVDPSAPAKKRATRSTDERIADFEAKIAALRAREQQRKAKADPAVRFLRTAARSIDKALTSTSHEEASGGMRDVRSAIADLLAQLGMPLSDDDESGEKAGAVVTTDALLAFISDHGGLSFTEIAQGMGTDAAGIRGALDELKASGQVRAEGRSRGTRYHAVA